MKTLRQIWIENGETLPFAARLKFWAKDTYVVILRFGAYVHDPNDLDGLQYQEHPVGIPLTNDKPNNIFLKYPLYAKYFLIPRYDYPEWENVTDINLERFERKDIHSLNNYIQFGKHYGKSVNDLINTDFGYIKWMIQKSDYTFDKPTMTYIAENIPNFDIDLIKKAEEKENMLLEYLNQNPVEDIEEIEPLPPSNHWNIQPTVKVVQPKNWDTDEVVEVKKELKITNAYIDNLHSTFAQNMGGPVLLYVNDALKWSTSDDVQLKGLHSKGASAEQIGNIMRRKPNTVRKRMRYLKLIK